MDLNAGAIIPISLQLPDGNTSRFPRAYIYNADRSLFAGPINLVHNAFGEYKAASSYFMPNQPFVVVQYLIFTDAGHSSPDPRNGSCEDLWSLGAPLIESNEIKVFLDADEIVAAIEECQC